eukprot:Nitzschia sp. Nitz4//scaffold7_size249615//187985//188713//NITZ4_001199-RA/size249615-processed-gene-0.367-mRNA-1//-1//CDS//3329558508//7880//frame0
MQLLPSTGNNTNQKPPTSNSVQLVLFSCIAYVAGCITVALLVLEGESMRDSHNVGFFPPPSTPSINLLQSYTKHLILTTVGEETLKEIQLSDKELTRMFRGALFYALAREIRADPKAQEVELNGKARLEPLPEYIAGMGRLDGEEFTALLESGFKKMSRSISNTDADVMVLYGANNTLPQDEEFFEMISSLSFPKDYLPADVAVAGCSRLLLVQLDEEPACIAVLPEQDKMETHLLRIQVAD